MENSNLPNDSENYNNEGPQFGLEEEEGWLSKYGGSVMLPIIAILILAGGIYLYATQKEGEEDILALDEEPDILNEDIIDLTEEDSEIVIDLTEDNEELVVVNETVQEVEEPVITIAPVQEGNQIVVRAAQGEGVTHLARHALRKYLENSGDSTLTNEHKVYIEDYLKDRTGNNQLALGEEVSFSEGLIEEAINASSQLTARQLEVLETYSRLVDWNN